MSKKTENQTPEKNRLIGHLTYLPHGEKGHDIRVGAVFATKRGDCQSVAVESIPLRLIQDVQRGQLGSFFIWARKEDGA